MSAITLTLKFLAGIIGLIIFVKLMTRKDSKGNSTGKRFMKLIADCGGCFKKKSKR